MRRKQIWIMEDRISRLISKPSVVILVLILTFVSNCVYGQDKSESRKTDGPASQTGIDPTDIRTRFEGAYTYNERSNNVKRHNLNLRLDRAFIEHGMSLRLEVPVVYAELPQSSSQSGLGNIGVTYSYRYKNTTGHSALVSGVGRFDTATDDALGDGTTKLTGVWVNSWRKDKWIFSAVTLATWSESGEYDAAGAVPFIGYQPMKAFLSYASLGVPFTRNFDREETSTAAVLRFGKVFGGGSVAFLGTRIDLSGNSDDELVVTIGYRIML